MILGGVGNMKNGFIICYDSGIGGVSVLADAKKLLPDEDFIYFGDIVNAPYGQKSRDEVHQLVLNNINHLLTWDIKALLLACNTATSSSVAELRNLLDIPIFGMEPAIKPAVQNTEGQIIVLGTTLTLKEEKFRNLLESLGQERDIVALPCPGLVELIEDNPEKPAVGKYIKEILAPYKDSAAAVVLGCTHYLFVKPWLQTLLPDVQIFDGNDGVSRNLAKVLKEEDLMGGMGQIVWLSSLEDDEENELFVRHCWDAYDFYNQMEN
jgi:glutamate racemase